MNAKNILLIASLTFMCTQNMQAMHIKAIKPLSRMQYVRSISNQPKRNISDLLLITGICCGIASLFHTLITEYGPKVDIAKEIEKKYESKNNNE